MNTNEARGYIQDLISAYFPSDGTDIKIGEQGFDHIAKDYQHDSKNTKGTTCGFLPHWLFWRAGCSGGIHINRFEPDAGLVYEDAWNISHLDGARAFHGDRIVFDQRDNSPLFREMAEGQRIRPSAGDAVVVLGTTIPKNRKYDKNDPEWQQVNGPAHTFVFLGEDALIESDGGPKFNWKVAELGAGNGPADQRGHLRTHTISLDNKYKFPWTTIAGRDLRVYGWVSLDQLEFNNSPPIDSMRDPLQYVRQHASFPGEARLMGTWAVTSSYSDFPEWFYHFYKGGRVFFEYNVTPPLGTSAIPYQKPGGGRIGDGHARPYDGCGLWFWNGQLWIKWMSGRRAGDIDTWSMGAPDTQGKWTATGWGGKSVYGLFLGNQDYTFSATLIQS